MDEMYLMEQISAIEEVLDSIDLLRDDVARLGEEMESALAVLRGNGLRKEISDKVDSFMKVINDQMDALLVQMDTEDRIFLEEVHDTLEDILNEM